MSCYEWERGEIIIPKDEWARFKRELREAYNRALAQDFATVLQAVERMKIAHKGKRNVDWREALYKAITGTDSTDYSRAAQEQRDRFSWLILDWYVVREAVLVGAEEGPGSPKKYRVRVPKKKDFPLAGSNSKHFAAGEGAIVLDDERHTVTWSVSENNRACEAARSSFMGRTLFQLLERIQWKRNSGGDILGNDEYNRDRGSDYLGAGGSYLKNSYGPLGESARRMPSRRSARALSRADIPVTVTPGMLHGGRHRY